MGKQILIGENGFNSIEDDERADLESFTMWGTSETNFASNIQTY